MIKALGFLLFLIVFGAWIWLCAKAFNKLQSSSLAGSSFWGSEALLLLSQGGFFGFVYLLSGLWSLKLVLLFLASAHLGILLNLPLTAILSGDADKCSIRWIWAGREFDIRFTKFSKSILYGLGLVCMSYPFVVAHAYFHYPWSSEILKVVIIKYSLILLVMSGYAVSLPITAFLLMSENVDDDTRQRIFVNQLIGMIPTAPFVALAIWVFGAAGPAAPPTNLADLSHTLSVRPLLLLLGFFAATILLPYLIGTQRARKHRLGLLQARRTYVAKLADILESPTATAYAGKLGALHGEILSAGNNLIKDNTFLQAVEELERNPSQITPDVQPFIDSVRKTRDLDPRFAFLDFTKQLDSDVAEIVTDLQQRTGKDAEEAAGIWAKKFEQRKDEIAKEIDSSKTGRPTATIIMSTVGTTIITGILGEVSKSAWQIISGK